VAYTNEPIELPLGSAGLTSPNLSGMAPPETLLQALNVSFADGSIRREGGAALYTFTPVTAPYLFIEGGFDWWPDTGTQVQVIYAISSTSSAVLRDASNGVFGTLHGPETLATFLPPVFVEGGAELPGRAKKLFLFRTSTNTLVLSGNGFSMTVIGGTPLTPPDLHPSLQLLPVGSGGGPGNVDNGGHHYLTTFVTAGGETTAGAVSPPLFVFDKTAQGIVKVINIQVGPANTIARKLYRSKANTFNPWFLLTTLNNNTQTEFIDNVPDASLPTTEPPTVNTTNGRPLEWGGDLWPSTGANHARRLWAAGNLNDPHRVYYSIPDDHENFMSAGSGSLSIYPGEGQYIVGMLSLGDRLAIWKYPNGIYTVDTSNIDPNQWSVGRYTRAYGGINGTTQAMIEGDVIFLDPNGEFHLLSAVEEFTNLGGQSLSRQMHMDEFFRSLAEPFGLFYARMVYYSAKREVHVAFRPKGYSHNQNRLVIDFNAAQPRFRLSNRDTCESLWISTHKALPSTQATRLMSGDDTGNVWMLDQAATHKQGAGYVSRFQTMWNDIGLPTIDKNAEFLELHLNPGSTGPISVKAWWDSSLATESIITVAAPANPTAVAFRRLRLTGGGRRLSLEIEQSAPSNDFSIARAFLSYSPRDERVKS
jgi:hypothetical protein